MAAGITVRHQHESERAPADVGLKTILAAIKNSGRTWSNFCFARRTHERVINEV